MKAPPSPWIALLAMLCPGGLVAGPYSAGWNDPTSVTDAPIPGFVGPDGEGGARLFTGQYDSEGGPIYQHPRNFVNPLFFDWAATVQAYAPAPGVSPFWMQSALTLGAVTGDVFDVASLGDLSTSQIATAVSPGSLTLHFDHPIRNLSGADFTVFENAFIATSGPAGILAELAFVEVSADGVNFLRFPARSLTAALVGSYGTIDPTDVRNLAGKHLNAYGVSWGTPFDLADLPSPGLASVSYVRLVDIPGSGAFLDSVGHPIYDAWLTTGSGGADIEAVGAISRITTFDEWQDLRGLVGAGRGPDADPNGNGLPNLLEYAFSRIPDQNADPSSPTRLELAANRLELIFTRDERATDLTYEVQARDSLTSGSWTTIARSIGGQPCVGVAGFSPSITEISASPIASVGVVRKVRVADVQTVTGQARRFLRVKVTAAAP